jgi:hypothetical protein
MFKIMRELKQRQKCSPPGRIGAWRRGSQCSDIASARDRLPRESSEEPRVPRPARRSLTAVSPARMPPPYHKRSAAASLPALRRRPRGQFVTRRDQRAPRPWPFRATKRNPQSRPIHRNARALAPPAAPRCSLCVRESETDGTRAARRRGPRTDPGPARARRGRSAP